MWLDRSIPETWQEHTVAIHTLILYIFLRTYDNCKQTMTTDYIAAMSPAIVYIIWQNQNPCLNHVTFSNIET
uniref:Uncharacterized protein n=1 Tax=Arundo donax TaxID=35708 RepID=A0A0A8ZBN7_ARUDO